MKKPPQKYYSMNNICAEVIIFLNLRFFSFKEVFDLVCVYAVDHSYHNIHSERRRAAVAHEGESDTDDGEHCKAHSDVFYSLNGNGGGNADADAGEGAGSGVNGKEANVVPGNLRILQNRVQHGHERLAVRQADIGKGRGQNFPVLRYGNAGRRRRTVNGQNLHLCSLLKW